MILGEREPAADRWYEPAPAIEPASQVMDLRSVAGARARRPSISALLRPPFTAPAASDVTRRMAPAPAPILMPMPRLSRVPPRERTSQPESRVVGGIRPGAAQAADPLPLPWASTAATADPVPMPGWSRAPEADVVAMPRASATATAPALAAPVAVWAEPVAVPLPAAPAPAAPAPAPMPRTSPAAWRPRPRPQRGLLQPAGLDPSVQKVLAGLGLIAAYVAICLSPLLIVSAGYHAPRRPFLVQFSVALAYVGLAMMVLQFTLVSRIKWLSAPFGIDILHRFHREISFVALAFLFAHPVLLLVQSVPTYLPLFDVLTAPWRARFAVASMAALPVVFVISLWRRKIRISYEVWKLAHGVISTAAVFLGLAHMVGVNRFTSGLGGRVVVVLVAVGILGVLGWSRLIAPRLHLFRPWRVVEVIHERGRAITLVVQPHGHPGWSFLPGQFAWVTIGHSPFSMTQHPFSLSSPGDVEPGGRVTLTIKELGDFTKGIGSIRSGARVYLDGPHGSFSMDLKQAPGYVFIAGGVGITPIYSMVSTMCLREDTRPVVLFYANRDWEGITFREQLDELRLYMPNLKVVHVLKSPPPGWTGEQGPITPELLYRHLPRQYASFEFFICASDSMRDAIEAAVLEIGVPDYRVHAERFGMV